MGDTNPAIDVPESRSSATRICTDRLLDVIQRWQDESLRLFAEVAHGGRRREWWAGFLDSYYKIALPLGLRQTPITF